MNSNDTISLIASSPASASDLLKLAPDGSAIHYGGSFDVEAIDFDTTANTADLGFDLPTGTEIRVTSASPTGGLSINTNYFAMSQGDGKIKFANNLNNANNFDPSTGLPITYNGIGLSSAKKTTFQIRGTKEEIIGLNIHDVNPSECGHPMAVNTFTARFNAPVQLAVAPVHPTLTTISRKYAGTPVYAKDNQTFLDTTAASGRLMGYLAHNIEHTDKSGAQIVIATIVRV